MTIVRPAWPFPPHGVEPAGVVDLGVRLRDAIFRRQHLERQVRPALFERLTRALAVGDGSRAASLVEAILDTFPAAAMVDEARRRWTEGPDARALGVLARSADLAATGSGADLGWPTPTVPWVKRVIGNRIPLVVERYHSGDGAMALAEALGASLRDAPPPTRLGLQPARWSDLIGPAPGAVPGPCPECAVRVISLPGTPRQLRAGQAEPVAWMVWDGPHPGIPITGAASAVLQLADGSRDLEDLADALSVRLEVLTPIVDALARVGAFKSLDPEPSPRTTDEGDR